MRKLFAAAFLFLCATEAYGQGAAYTAGPFNTSGPLYVCTTPVTTTPCSSFASLFSNAALSSAISNPFPMTAGVAITFYVTPGQYAVQMPNAGFSQIVTIGGGSGGTAGSVKNAPVPSSAYTFYPATDSTCATYSAAGTNYCSLNNSTGAVTTNTDAAVLLNTLFAANASTCGTMYFKNGDYLLNSVTLEGSATTYLLGGSLFYAVAIPANAGSTNQYCQWHFEGEQASYASGTALQAQGVIFDVTATAITAAAPSTNLIAAFWHRPDTTNNVGNDVFFKNITIRFPVNTRGNECAFCMYEASTVDYENTMATLATNPGAPLTPNIVAATAGTNRMVAYTSTKNAHNNWQHFRETWAIGYDIGYDIESEHGVMDSVSGLFLNNLAYYGRIAQASTIVHPGVWLKVTDQENINGITLGAGMAQGSEFDIFGYDVELANGVSNAAFVRSSNLTETNCNYTSGIITYQVVTQTINSATNTNGLWNSGCGAKFQMLQGDNGASYQNPVQVDNFSGPNTTLTLAPPWVQFNAGIAKVCDVTSNTARTHLTTSACGVAYQGQTFNNDQFGSLKCTAIESTGTCGISVRNISTFLTVRTMYKYVCSTSGGVITNRAIFKFLNNASTLLTQTASASGCAANDILELDAIGTTLLAYYNGALDLVTTDSSITSGSPGFEVSDSASITGTSISNWVGGSLPTKTGTDSIYGKAAIHPSYYTTTNCNVNGVSPAACGSAAAGSVVVPTTTTTYTVNTTAVTTSSRIFLVPITDATGLSGAPTCVSPPTGFIPIPSGRTAGTSFTFSLPSTTGTACIEYWIVN